MTRKKLEDIYFECMRDLYRNSIGLDGKQGDFDYLLENATILENGLKEIPFMDYYIPDEKFKEILDKWIPKNATKYEQNILLSNICMGASPTSCEERWMKKRDNICE